jgi:hypothetical protein
MPCNGRSSQSAKNTRAIIGTPVQLQLNGELEAREKLDTSEDFIAAMMCV